MLRAVTNSYSEINDDKMEKNPVSIALDDSQLEWIDGEIQKRRFANRSHAIQYAIQKLMDE